MRDRSSRCELLRRVAAALFLGAAANFAVGATDSSGTFQATLSADPSGPVLNWPSDASHYYQIQQSTDAVTWTNFGHPQIGSGSPMTAGVTLQSTAHFYRVLESADYYDAQPPSLSVVSSVPPALAAHQMTASPVTIQIHLASGGSAPNAPVTVSVPHGDAQLSLNGSALVSAPLSLTTDSSGNITFWVQAGNSFNLDTVEVTAGNAEPVDISFRPTGDYSGFYGYFEGDLEQFDGSIDHIFGKLHSNANVWLGSYSSLTANPVLYADLSAATSLNNAFPPNFPTQVRGGESCYPYQVIPPARSDILIASWVGAPAFGPPDGNPNDASGPHVLLEPVNPEYPDWFAQYRLNTQAGVVIVVNSSVPSYQFSTSGLTPTALRTALLPTVSQSTMIDAREGAKVVVTSLDIQALLQGIANYFSSAHRSFNGIVYVEDVAGLTTNSTTRTAIRFKNGATIPNLVNAVNPNGGLVLASPNGVYLQGDFNCGVSPYSNSFAASTNFPVPADVLANNGAGDTLFQTFPVASGYVRKPVMIACDAFTALSNSWQDANSSNSSPPQATSTTMNLLVLTGNVPTTFFSYSGGLIETIRLSENWSTAPLTFYGALVVPYTSQYFTGVWKNANYAPPIRKWYYDPLFLTTPPPGLPTIQLAAP